MARKFLYVIAGLTALVIAAMFALSIWSEDLTEMAFVPKAEFTPQPEVADNAYRAMDMWISRPGIGAGDPVRWLPQGFPGEDAQGLEVAVFFVHPTSYLERAQWNAPLDDKESRARAELFVRAMASPFNRTVDIWVPRYRQAAFGAFLTDKPEGKLAIDLAYKDVEHAFDLFAATVSRKSAIVLAGHSQGAFHLRRLMRERVAGTPLASRIAAVYAIGWPISVEHDLPAMGLPACSRPEQRGCLVSWQSFAEPAETEMLVKEYGRQPGLDGKPLTGSAFVCTNPLTGQAGGGAAASANHGTLVPEKELKGGKLVPGLVGAVCRRDGVLSIGKPRQMGPYVLPGNNYHVYDIPLFWMNLRDDFTRRVEAWQPSR